MDELTPVLPPNLEAALDEFYAAPRPDPAFAARLGMHLRRRQIELVSHGRKSRFSTQGDRRTLPQTLRARPALALVAAILALLALTGMAYALGWLAGFIPGFGFTSPEGSVHVLAEQVEGTAGGITLQVNQAVDDGERFWVEVNATGLTGQEDLPRASLLLRDGEKIQFQEGGSSGNPEESKMKMSFLFPPLSKKPQKLVLLVEGLSDEELQLPLKLKTVQPSEIVPVPLEGSPPLQSESRDGVRLVLDRVAVDSNKTVFQVSLQYDRPNTWLAGPWSVSLSDENGALYPLTDVTPDTMTTGDTHVYQTVPFTGGEQLVLTLVTFPPSDTLPMFVDFSGDSPGFTFDPGANPEIGQRWELNQPLSTGGFDLKVVSATLTDEPGLEFVVEPVPPVTGVMFRSPDPLVTGSSGETPVQSGNATGEITFSRIPQQPFEVQLMRVYYQAKGPWQIHWQPPAAPTPAAGAPTPTATLAPPPVATPTLAASDDPILLEVQQLARKFETPFQQRPGWVHVVTETLTNPDAGQDYPPPYLKSEQWYEIDEEGYVTRMVWLDYDESGQIIQQSATVGNYSVNFTFAFSGFKEGPRYRITLVGLVTGLTRAIEQGLNVSREEVACEDGRPCLLVSTWETFPEAVQNPGEAQAFSGIGHRGWIDLDTGMQVKEQSFWQMADGSERVESTSSTLLVEKMEAPPQEILDILHRVIVP